MTLSQILIIGAAPNPVQNATLPEARAMGSHLGAFATVLGKVIYTAEKGPSLGALVPVESIEPAVPEDAELNYHLMLEAPGREIPFSVAIWHGTVSRWGPRKATAWVLDVINPAWREDTSLVAKVDELADVAPTVVVPDLPPVAAMPDWDNPRTEGVLGVRVGDHSPTGTLYRSPAGVLWTKGQWLSPFETTWKRT